MAISSSTIINTLGAGSGIDVNNLAQSLVDAEKVPQKERIDAKIAKTEAKITGYSAIKYALSELKNAFGKLNDASDFSSIVPANTQAAAFGVTAGSTAEAGSYSIEVLQTALAQRTASSSFSSNSEVLNGGAAFTLNLNIAGESQDPLEVSTATPDGMVKAINSADLGVTAQIIYTGSGYSIVVSGKTGADQAFTLSSDDGTGSVVTGVAFGTPLQTSTDASFKINGLTVSRSSNTVNDVIDGVTLELFANTTGAARLDLNRDNSGIKDNILGLVTAYNDFEDTLQILSDRTSEVEEFGGVLSGESLLRNIRNQVRDMVTATSSTAGETVQSVRDIGLSIDRNGKLILDESQLGIALQDNFTEVSTMFSAGTNNQSIYSTTDAGLAGDAINDIEKMLLSSGSINTQSLSASAEITKYKETLTKLDERMEKLLTRYMKQFSIMESIVGSSNSMRENLKSTFEGMMKAYTN
jgi:flagellar hook-associated protein 2